MATLDHEVLEISQYIDGVKTEEGTRIIGVHSGKRKAVRVYLHLPEDMPVTHKIKKANFRFYQQAAIGGVKNLRVMLRDPNSSHIYDYFYMIEQNDSVEKEYNIDVTDIMEYALENGMSYVEVLMDMVGGSTSHPDAYISLFTDRYSIIFETESVALKDFSHRAVTHEISKFGTGFVDPIDRTLSFECTDFEWQGNRLPVTLKHYYNSTVCNGVSALGCGWRLNLMQTLVKDGEKYVYTDEKGLKTDITLNTNDNRYKSADGELVLAQTDLYSDFNYSTFNYDPELVILKADDKNYFFDTNGRLIIIGDKYRNFIRISYDTEGNISTVKDSAGADFIFTYENGKLIEIYAPDSSKLTFEYSDDNLSKIIYPDYTYACIGYDSESECLSSICLCDVDGNIVREYVYSFVCNCLTKIYEYGYKDNVWQAGVQTAFGYSINSKTATVTITEPEQADSQPVTTKTVLRFDDNCEVTDKYTYITSNGNSVVNDEGKGIQASAANLLLNGGFDTLSGWSVSKTANANILSAGNIGALYGDTYLHLSPGSTSAYDDVYQTVSALPAGEYNFSCYANVLSVLTGSTDAGILLRVTDSAGNIIAESERVTETGVENYSRLSCGFTLLNPDSVTVHILALGNGLVCVEAAQLENNPYPSKYNIIVNGGFESGTDGWTVSGTYADYAPISSSEEKFSVAKSLKMPAVLDVFCSAYQSVDVKTSKNVNETFTLSGWAKGCTFPVTQRTCNGTVSYQPPVFRMYAQTTYADGETVTHSVDFLPNQTDWQFAKVTFTNDLYQDITDMKVVLECGYNSGDVYFDDISLTRDYIAKDLNDSDFEQEDSSQTESLTEKTPDKKAEVFEEYTDDRGNTITDTAYSDDESGTVYRSFAYDDYGRVTRETDARGNMTYYSPHSKGTGNYTVTDRCGNTTYYDYDDAGKMFRMVTDESRVEYAYNALDSITQIQRFDGQTYNLGYTAFNDLESIGIEGKEQSLVRYGYNQSGSKLKSVTYANGHTMTATYNSLGQMTAEKWYDTEDCTNLVAHYKYLYNAQGNIIRSLDLTAGKYYNYVYTDEKLTQAFEYDAVIVNENVSSKTLVLSVSYFYDSDEQLTKTLTTFADGTKRECFYSNTENGTRLLKFKVRNDLPQVTSRSKTDSLGRKEFDGLLLGGGYINRRFYYHNGVYTAEHSSEEKIASLPTTNLVSRIDFTDAFSNGFSLLYEYDNEERITKVTEVSNDIITNVTEYTYDALGQLLTETVNGNVINTMTYDGYGNILKKNNISYTYDSVWKDQLVQAGSQYIYYDAQGNPVSYLGHTLTWEKGRQLKSFDTNTYTYNANGIRTSKTVDGITYKYIVDGIKILRQEWDGNTLIPIYDNEDSVCGIVYNDTAYYFVKNLQGDVIAITDKFGSIVARYSYDAWGKCTITEDSSENDIASINPYRYRSYYYDSEIDMYYLQSRYYDANVGRFVNADEPEFAIVNENVLQNNLYAYCCNDSVNYYDPFGYYVGSLTFSSYLISTLSGALAGIMTGMAASIASLKAALVSSWLIPVCIAAATVAIVGIVYVVNRVLYLSTYASQVISAVKTKVNNKGVDPNKLGNYTVYVIVKNYTTDVIYVGITKRYSTRKNQHKKRFSTSKYTMMPIATWLTKNQARALEQTIITAYGLDTLKNLINSISPKKWSYFKSEFEQIKTLIQSWTDPE